MATKMNDGFSTKITFDSLDTYVWEKETTPVGISAGGAIDTTTMHNTAYRTQAPKSLKTLTDASMEVAYAPEALTPILALIGINQEIEVIFPDNSVWRFWGWVDEFTPNSNTEGEMPTASMTIIPSNVGSGGSEIAPSYYSSGTAV